jgi:NAD(P)-dependent dehydrogenase (short-subunit alcohol dehydrogenase family)
MKLMIVGASGTLGRAIVEHLAHSHELIKVAKTQGDYQVDITSEESIKALFEKVGRVDGIISVTGNLHFSPISEMTGQGFNIGLNDKLLGQVNLALIGQNYLNEGGSITLTSGIVSQQPIKGGTNASTVNAALEGFVKSAAIEFKNGQRINAISPSVVTESLDVYGPFFPGYESVPAQRVAMAFQRSIEGGLTGQTFNVW